MMEFLCDFSVLVKESSHECGISKTEPLL